MTLPSPLSWIMMIRIPYKLSIISIHYNYPRHYYICFLHLHLKEIQKKSSKLIFSLFSTNNLL